MEPILPQLSSLKSLLIPIKFDLFLIVIRVAELLSSGGEFDYFNLNLSTTLK